MDGWTTACIALGANLGDRADAISAAMRAIRALPGVRVLRVSRAVETDAVTLPGDPPQPPYLNAAAVIETSLSPRALLDQLLAVERDLGRDRTPGRRWEARTIDLDILLYADTIIDEPGLTIPHPRMHERAFVLRPLAEVAPDARHPVLGKTVAELLRELEARDAPHAPPRRTALAIIVAVGLAASYMHAGVGIAAPPPPAQTKLDDTLLDPHDLLKRARKAYLRAPIAEEAVVTLRSSAPTRTETIRWRFEAGQRLRVEMGDLVATAAPGGASVAHARWGRVHRVPLEESADPIAALLRVLPPLPLPQLALALDERETLAAVPPFCEGIEWFSVLHERGLYILEGVGPDSTITLELDEETLRVLTATMRTRGADSALALTVETRPLDADATGAWPDDPPAAREVDSLSSLAPAHGDVRVGDDAPDLLLLTPEARPWRLQERLTSRAGALALVLFRDFDAGAEAARSAVATLASRGLLHAALGAVIDPAEADPLDALSRNADRWRGAGEGAPPLLWTVTSATTIDRFAPDAPSVLVLVGRDWRIAAIVPLENRAGDGASLTREITDALGLASE